jgi:hypothetical protein
VLTPLLYGINGRLRQHITSVGATYAKQVLAELAGEPLWSALPFAKAWS